MLHLEIEPTNLCNTRCLHCPRERLTRAKGEMGWIPFRTIMDRAFSLDHEVSVVFGGMGEPLLNPSIFQFISYVSGRGKTSLTTNGSVLDPLTVERLIGAGLGCLTISFNGIDKASYELMMGGLNFEKARRGLELAIGMSKGQGMKVAANVSVTKQTQDRLSGIRSYLTHIGVDTILFSKCHNRGGYLDRPDICDTPMPPFRNNVRCDIFAGTLFVAWNGDVLSCCHDLTGIDKLGNLTTDEIEIILEHKGRINKNGVNFEICRRCNDMYRYMNDPTPDRSLLSEWIYSLYAGEDERTQRLLHRIEDLEREVKNWESLWKDFQMSMGGRFLRKLHHWRRILTPPGTLREKFLQLFLQKAGVLK